MQALNSYHWAQDKIDEVVTGTKHREQAACERRLRQMQTQREKQAARAAKAIPDGDGIAGEPEKGNK